MLGLWGLFWGIILYVRRRESTTTLGDEKDQWKNNEQQQSSNTGIVICLERSAAFVRLSSNNFNILITLLLNLTI